MNDTVSFIPIGGVVDVTKNMYLYEYKDQILVVDCGLGFADETMLGVDLLLPDISYLLSSNKKIVGMVLTHGHEDHIGALPFILPQLSSAGKISQDFQIYGSPLTAALANEKLKEFGVGTRVKTVNFEDSEKTLGDFKVSFIRVTHSIPDASNLFIKTPVGNFYHGSDFKFDLTPVDGKRAEFNKIVSAAEEGILCLMSDSLGSERPGYTLPEEAITESFEREMNNCRGKFIVTTYSSNISRLNQAIEVAKRNNRKVCFVGRSLMNAKDIAQELGYMNLSEGLEVSLNQLKNYKDRELLLFIAGSQGQENSALTRVANGEHREVKLSADDVVIFSADPIPGNEVAINSLIDSIAKKGVKVIYSQITDDFHVSGHGSSHDLMLMMSLTKSQKVLPIGGTYRQMVAYKNIAQKMGYKKEDILIIEDGQEVIFSKEGVTYGKKLDAKNVYVDEVTGEEVEHFILRDRQKLSESGVIIVLAQIDSMNGQIIGSPDVIARGFVTPDSKMLSNKITQALRISLENKKGKVTNWFYVRKLIGDIAENVIYKELKRNPLVLPVVIEV